MRSTPAESKRLGRQVAEVIRLEMARMRISQADLARRLGTSQQSVSRRVSGSNALTIDELHQYCKALDLDARAVLHAAHEEVPA